MTDVRWDAALRNGAASTLPASASARARSGVRTPALAVLIVAAIALGACRTTADGPEQPSDTAKPEATAPAAAAPATTPAPAAQPAQSQAARAPAAKPAELPPERDPQYTPEQRALMIRQICWGQVDRQRGLRGDDARIAWVTKCIADKTKESLGDAAAPKPAAPAAPAGPARR